MFQNVVWSVSIWEEKFNSRRMTGLRWQIE